MIDSNVLEDVLLPIDSPIFGSTLSTFHFIPDKRGGHTGQEPQLKNWKQGFYVRWMICERYKVCFIHLLI